MPPPGTPHSLAQTLCVCALPLSVQHLHAYKWDPPTWMEKYIKYFRNVPPQVDLKEFVAESIKGMDPAMKIAHCAIKSQINLLAGLYDAGLIK